MRSFLWLSNIPLCICTTTSLSIHLLMDKGEVSQKEKDKYHVLTYIWNLEKWYWIIYLQSNNGETDIENLLMDMGRREERMRWKKKRLWIAKAIWRKKNRAGGIRFHNFILQSYSNQESIILAQKQINGTGQKARDKPTHFGHLIYDKWCGNSGNSGWLYFGGLQNQCRWWLSARKLKDADSLEGKLWPT